MSLSRLSVLAKHLLDAVDRAFVVGDKPLFIGLTELILLADSDALKDLLHLFFGGGQLHPLTDQHTLIVLAKVRDEASKLPSNTGIGILLSVIHHAVRHDIQFLKLRVAHGFELPDGFVHQLCDLAVHVVQGDVLHIVDQPLPAGRVEAAHQVGFFHGKFFISEFHILSFVFLRLRCVRRLGFLCGFQLVADGFTGSGLLRNSVIDGNTGIFHIRADILDAFRKTDGAVLVLDVGQPDFIGAKSTTSILHLMPSTFSVAPTGM